MSTFAGLVRRLSPDQRAATLVALSAAVLAGWNLTNAPEYQDDEGTYTAQALSVLNGSLAPYTYWYDHPPLGWVQLSLLSWIPPLLGQGGQSAVGQMRYVVAVFFVASTVLVYLIARRLELRQVFAVTAAALFCLSPLSLVLGRQVFIDNVGVPWLLVAFYLMLSPQLKLWHHIGAGVCFAVAVLSKETLAIFGPALLLALLHRPSWKTRLFSLVGFMSIGGLVLGFYPLLALLQGELVAGPGHVSLQDAFAYQFISRPGSGSLFDGHSGRTELVMGWVYYDKYLLVAGIMAALVCLLRRETRWIPAALALFSLPVIIGRGYLPAMYVIAAIPFLVMAIAVAADLTWRGVLLLFPAVPLGRHTQGIRNPGMGTRIAALGITGGAMLAVTTVLLLPQWMAMNRTLLVSNTNADWQNAMEWSRNNLPKEDTALVPYSMWQDINGDGRHDPWKVIALEKMDLDSAFEVHHPEGWRAIQWIVEGPPTARNIRNLALTNAGKALDHSRIVASFGPWHIRQVQVGPENDGQPGTPPPPVPAGEGQ
ncbi:glycosyltransferase family 39 protein [Arthrobacter sp. NicSoilC5]|uniref:glycosyltransferase family 39 protein n=1 Tax=Arthrobacter sp. NicSoilC5 TaxID=2831000 RepID=UPI001CC46DF4|nr:glycosyltransferase family 39 protein [Arthrobacter sp. NicSoilC5]BCW79721.1 hypothetical protein NicSoilC5_17400 [Arthrobacter sp. NicSoilC5]